MKIEEKLWLDWLVKKSMIRRSPILFYLSFYLAGSILWRISWIEWNWWLRDISLLPYGLFLLPILIYIYYIPLNLLLRVFRHHFLYLLVSISLLVLGFFYPAYIWQKTNYPHQLDPEERLKMVGRVIRRDGDNWETRIQGLYGRVVLYQPITNFALEEGDRVLIRGRLEPFLRASNPGQFNYQYYRRYSGFVGQVYKGEVQLLARPENNLIRWLNKGKSKAQHFFKSNLSKDSYPLIMALLTGDKDYLDSQFETSVRKLGLSHILAISGLHLGLIILWVGRVISWCQIPTRIQPIILIIAIWLVVAFVGFPTSALRVGIFITLQQIALLLNKPTNSINILALTGWLIIIKNPLIIFLLSFQLSFIVYLAIFLLYQPILDMIKLIFPTRPEVLVKLYQSLALSLAAFLGSAPILLFHFYKVSLMGIVMNLWAVPFIGLILAGLVATLISGLILPINLLSLPLDYLVMAFNKLVEYCSQFNGEWEPGQPPLLLLPIIFLLLAQFYQLHQIKGQPIHWYQKKKRRRYMAGLLLVVLVLLIIFAPPSIDYLELICIDVGQGDSFFLTLPGGFTILVDGGGRHGEKNVVGEEYLKPFLLSRGISEVDLVCISHFDTDHVKGLLTILRDFKIKQIWAPRRSESEYVDHISGLVQKKQIPIFHPISGQSFQIGQVEIEIIHPTVGEDYSDENQRSIVFKLVYGDQKILFTGDLGIDEEKKLLARGIDLEADFLKIGHHGSKYSTCPTFLEAVDPKVAIISVGQNNYGHPAQQVLDYLKMRKTKVLRTDEGGAIQILLDKKGKVQLNYFKD